MISDCGLASEKTGIACTAFCAKAAHQQGKTGRIALLHAIAHIELNAIDLSLDIAVRYAKYGLPFAFVEDWLSVAGDEARHFTLLKKVGKIGRFYGALPAHDGVGGSGKTASDLAGVWLLHHWFSKHEA